MSAAPKTFMAFSSENARSRRRRDLPFSVAPRARRAADGDAAHARGARRLLRRGAMQNPRRTRVLVVGAGPAGLAAAARILERGGKDRFRVRLAGLGHHTGGKASSWRDAEGRLIDHGQHVIVGWYREMKAFIRRAGVDVDARLVSNEGHTHVYEPRDGKVHELALKRNPLHVFYRAVGFSGLTAAEKANITQFVVSNLATFMGLQDIEQFDDICFTSWCLANGLAPSIVQTSSFRMSRTGQLNWPGEISAYSLLKTVVKVGRDYRTAQYSFCDGGMTDRFWDPILHYVSALGGEYEMMKKLTGLEIAGGRLVGATFAEPDSAGHHAPERDPGRSQFEGTVPVKAKTVHIDRDFDYLISTLPATSFKELSPGDDALWGIPTFGNIQNIRGVAPFALQIWHREKLTKRYPSVIGGLDGPLGFVLDNKPIIREYRHDPRYGAVLYFVGQETGYERWTDEEHLALCLENVKKLPGYERIDRAGILHYQVIRHRSPHKAYFYTEPGIQKFRPHARTPIPNLMMAGDWVRTDIDFPCMEAAVRSGLQAADAVVEAAS